MIHPLAESLAPVNSLAARLIVCESRGRWAVELRRELAGAGVRVWEARTLADAWEMLAESPASFVVVEASQANLGGLLARLVWFQRDFPLARVATVADRTLTDCQWLVREAGAVDFCCSPRQLRRLAGTACRHLAGVPSAQQTLAERIWSSLPWARMADRSGPTPGDPGG